MMNYSTIGKYVKLVVFLIILELIANLDVLFQGNYSDYNITNEILYLLFEIDFGKREQLVIPVLTGLFPCMLFSFFESSEILKDKNIEVEHIIVRYPDRYKFLFHKIRSVTTKNCIYMGISIGIYFILAVRASIDQLQLLDAVFGAGFLLLFVLFEELHILLMNLLRIVFSQDKIIIIGFLCYIVETVGACCNLKYMNKCNPFFYLFMYWNLEWWEKLLGFFWLSFLNIAIIFMMCRVIQQTDIGIRSENL